MFIFHISFHVIEHSLQAYDCNIAKTWGYLTIWEKVNHHLKEKLPCGGADDPHKMIYPMYNTIKYELEHCTKVTSYYVQQSLWS